MGGFQAWILPGCWFSLAFDHLALGILVVFLPPKKATRLPDKSMNIKRASVTSQRIPPPHSKSLIRSINKRHRTGECLPLRHWGPSSAARRPGSPLPASGCAGRSSRWTSWGWSHLCPGSRTSCGPRFLKTSATSKKVEGCSRRLLFNVWQWTHERFKNTVHDSLLFLSAGSDP